MTGAKFELDNLTAIVDRNFIQIDGSTEDVMPLEPFAEKYRAFNWEVFECDGNDIAAFIETARQAAELQGQAASDHREHRARQGRLLHGRRLYVARKAAQRTAGRTKRCASSQAEREGDRRPWLAERRRSTPPPRRCISSTIVARSSRFRRATDSAKGLIEAGTRNRNVLGICADLSESTRFEGFRKAHPAAVHRDRRLRADARGDGRRSRRGRKDPVDRQLRDVQSRALVGASSHDHGAQRNEREDRRRARRRLGRPRRRDASSDRRHRDHARDPAHDGRRSVRLGADEKSHAGALGDVGARPTCASAARNRPSSRPTRRRSRSARRRCFAKAATLRSSRAASSSTTRSSPPTGSRARTASNAASSTTTRSSRWTKPRSSMPPRRAAPSSRSKSTKKHGGMGSRVAEILQRNYPVPIEFVGVDDRFGQSGDPVELIEYYGMGADAIVEAARRAHKRKLHASVSAARRAQRNAAETLVAPHPGERCDSQRRTGGARRPRSRSVAGSSVRRASLRHYVRRGGLR